MNVMSAAADGLTFGDGHERFLKPGRLADGPADAAGPGPRVNYPDAPHVNFKALFNCPGDVNFRHSGIDPENVCAQALQAGGFLAHVSGRDEGQSPQRL